MNSDRKVQRIGQLVQQARKLQGITQAQLAGVSGVGIRFISELEQGKTTCQIGKVLILLAMLGLDVTVAGEQL